MFITTVTNLFITTVTNLFIIWFISLIFISYFGFITLPHSGYFDNNFVKSLANWDGGHFLGIAQYGYTEKFQYAFFPLYPILINILAKFTNNYLLSGLLISIISAFLGFHFLFKLISRSFDKKIAEKTVLVLLFFPTSFYFLTVYSEGLFFLLTILTFYFLEGRKYFWASIFAALASATRFAGVGLILALIVDVWLAAGINRKNWVIFLSPLGLLIYSSFLYRQIGDPFYFVTAELHWQRSLSIPGISFWDTIKSATYGFLNINFNVLLDLLFAIFGLGFAIRSFRFLPIHWSIFGLVSIALPLFTPTLSSMPRFLLPVFPIFILIALLKNKYAFLGYQVISLMLLSLFTILFINGYWVS
ncbi:MAG: Uncharacterized protein G01um10147_1167 [Microgenomates group bacterium Gr01-1014_7]|nr:MAG: Uncharacterized protein G01um10147_1167 [Microgenomates group bacterium Gr01-1014_7]